MKGDTDTFRLRISLNTLTLYSQWSKPCQYIYFIQYQYECYCVLFQLHGNGLECPFYRSLSPLGQFCESSLQQRFVADCGTGDVPLFIPECRRGSCRISGCRLHRLPGFRYILEVFCDDVDRLLHLHSVTSNGPSTLSHADYPEKVQAGTHLLLDSLSCSHHCRDV